VEEGKEFIVSLVGRAKGGSGCVKGGEGYLLELLQPLDFILLFLLQSLIDASPALPLPDLGILDGLQAILKLPLPFFHLQLQVIDLTEGRDEEGGRGGAVLSPTGSGVCCAERGDESSPPSVAPLASDLMVVACHQGR
jgi:hypothetical protein